MARRIVVEGVGPVVILRSGHAPNLKAALKQIIKGATSQSQGFEEDDLSFNQVKVRQLCFAMGPLTGRQGPKLLNYDLQLLYEHVQTHNVQKVVVGFQDTEAFDGSLLADLIGLFQWVACRPIARRSSHIPALGEIVSHLYFFLVSRHLLNCFTTSYLAQLYGVCGVTSSMLREWRNRWNPFSPPRQRKGTLERSGWVQD